MSIATDEADKRYPFNKEASSDDELLLNDDNGLKNEGYIAGRTAEPTEAEVDAAAFAQFKAANTSTWTLTEEQYREAWNALPDMVSDDFRRNARIGLDAARKAVTGDERGY